MTTGFLAVLLLVLTLSPHNAAATTYVQDAFIDLTGEAYVTVWGVAVGDTDGDGRNELVTNYDWYIGSGNPRLVVFEWDGIQYVEEAAINNVSLERWFGGMVSPSKINIADVDGDGAADITFVGCVDTMCGLHVYSWNGSGYAGIGYVAQNDYNDVIVADADEDGELEVFMAAVFDVFVYEWNAGSLTLRTSWSVGKRVAHMSVADADYDDDLELVLAAGAGEGGGGDVVAILAYKCTGSGYAFEGNGTLAFESQAQGLGVGDLDDDGWPEVFVADYLRNMAVMAWNGSGYAVEWTGVSESLPGDNIGNVIVGDADNDGTPEIIVGHNSYVGGNSILVYEHIAGGYAVDWNSGWAVFYVHALAVGDADNDKLNEIVAGSGSQSAVHVFSAVAPADHPPIAEAVVSEKTGYLGTIFTFNGSTSWDDKGITAYEWDFGDGASMNGPSGDHSFSSRGAFEVTLTVQDTAGQNDSCVLLVLIKNRGPAAEAGPDQAVFKNTEVLLDGKNSSDPDSDSLTYAWSQIAGPSTALTGANTAAARFIPRLSGIYGFLLTVRDGQGGEATDTITIAVTNRGPVITSSSPLEDTVEIGNGEVRPFSVEAMDPDGDDLTYTWLVDGVQVATGDSYSFSSASSGKYVINVTVSDGEALTGHEWTVTIADDQSRPDDNGVMLWLGGGLAALAVILIIIFAWRKRRKSAPADDLSGSREPQS